MQKIISIIIPVYNEEKNIPLIKEELLDVFSLLAYDYEIIFVNDGSSDASQQVIDRLVNENAKIKSLEFSKNFGKEAATSAGLQYSVGEAVIVIDADLQHPVSLITSFIKHWESGADVVIGLREKTEGSSYLKSFCSYSYYKIINAISDTPIEPGATDFRLMDRKVVNEFNRLTEHDRMTRGLIDWLGFKREFVKFVARERTAGKPAYSYVKLVKLALSSFVAHSLFPLKFAGYLGIFIIFLSGSAGLIIIIERYIFGDVYHWNISGTALLGVLGIFFMGILLSCLGLIALYIGNIHSEVSGRPLYIVRSTNNIIKK